ncbi:secreted protein [Candidatus Magnetomorum sp. HK-1]|nr:secreted protein [Candidatus Magnetomorum sp. HK-1]
MRKIYSLIILMLTFLNTSCYAQTNMDSVKKILPCTKKGVHSDDALLKAKIQIPNELKNKTVDLGAFIYKDSLRIKTFGDTLAQKNQIYAQVVPYFKHKDLYYIVSPSCVNDCDNITPTSYSLTLFNHSSKIPFPPSCYTTLSILLFGNSNGKYVTFNNREYINKIKNNLKTFQQCNLLNQLIQFELKEKESLTLKTLLDKIINKKLNGSMLFALSKVEQLKKIELMFLKLQTKYIEYKIPKTKNIYIRLPKKFADIVSKDLSLQNSSFTTNNYCSFFKDAECNDVIWANCLDSYKELTITVLGSTFVKEVKFDNGFSRIIIKDSEINLKESKIKWPESWGKLTVDGCNSYSETSENRNSVLRCYGEWSNINLSKPGWKDITVSKKKDKYTYNITNKFVPDKNFSPMDSLSPNFKTITNCENELCYSYTQICYYESSEPKNKSCFSELENADIPFLYNQKRENNYNQKWKLPDTIELSLTYSGDNKFYLKNPIISCPIGESKKLTEYTMELLSPNICNEKVTYIISSKYQDKTINVKDVLLNVFNRLKYNAVQFKPLEYIHFDGSFTVFFQCKDFFKRSFNIHKINEIPFNNKNQNTDAFKMIKRFKDKNLKNMKNMKNIKKLIVITSAEIVRNKINDGEYYGVISTFTDSGIEVIILTTNKYDENTVLKPLQQKAKCKFVVFDSNETLEKQLIDHLQK